MHQQIIRARAKRNNSSELSEENMEDGQNLKGQGLKKAQEFEEEKQTGTNLQIDYRNGPRILDKRLQKTTHQYSDSSVDYTGEQPSYSSSQFLKAQSSANSQYTSIFSRKIHACETIKISPSKIQFANKANVQSNEIQINQKNYSRNIIESEESSKEIQEKNEDEGMKQIQQVRLRISKLQTSKKFTTPTDQISEQENEQQSNPMSNNLSPMKSIEDVYEQKTMVTNENERFPDRNNQAQISQNLKKKDNGGVLNFNTPTSVKIIDLRKPKIRQLLMQSLHDIVQSRKDKQHQMESKLFNENYENIIKNTIENRSLKVENSIPNPNIESERISYFNDRIPGEQSSEPQSQIILKSNISLSLNNSENKLNQSRSLNSNSLTHSQLNLQPNVQLLENTETQQTLGRMTPNQQHLLIQKLNQIFEEQKSSSKSLSENHQQPQSGSDSQSPMLLKENENRPYDDQCQIFSAINNDCLLYIANSTFRQSESKNHDHEQQTVSPDHSSQLNASSQHLSMYDPQLYQRQIDSQVMLEELSNRLSNIQQQTISIEDNECDMQQIGFVSRNNQNQIINNQNIAVTSSDQEQTLFINREDLQLSESKYEHNPKKKISKVPSVTDFTFFDLSNPQHLNKLFSRLEEIQLHENESRELPKVIRNQDQSLRIEPQSSITENQSGEASGNISSGQLKSPPINSRQSIEQQQFDVEILVKKLLQIKNVDEIESVLNVGGQLFQGSNDQSPQFKQGKLQRLDEDLAQGGESISSGGVASSIQSSGMMTPHSQNSLSTPNQIKQLQERNFNIQAFKVPIENNQNGQQMSHDLMSPVTKNLLMKKLKEVKEQIGDSETDSSDEDQNIIDGVVAGSIPDPRLFQFQQNKIKSAFKGQQKYDPNTGTITQKSIDRNQKTKLIFSKIDEEDENEEEPISHRNLNIDDKTKVNSLVSPSPRNIINQIQPAFQSHQPQIDQLINKLQQLELAQRQGSGPTVSRDNASAETSPIKIGNINVYNMQVPKPLPKQSEGETQQSQYSPMVEDPQLAAISRNESSANILEQVIKRLQKLKSRDSSV